MLDCDTFVKSILSAMWMLNDLPRAMRKDLDTQLGVVWLLMSDRNCFPSLAFTPAQQQGICEALVACSSVEDKPKYAYEALLQVNDLKLKTVEGAGENFGDALPLSSSTPVLRLVPPLHDSPSATTPDSADGEEPSRCTGIDRVQDCL
jgi:hypothetical protein